MFSKPKEAAKSLYEAGKAAAEKPYSQEFLKELNNIAKNEEYIMKAKTLADEGVLGAAEALEARKAADALKGSRSIRAEFLRSARETFDKIAKTKFSEADKVYKRGVQGEALRNIFPQNKYGGASGFKTALGAAMANFPGGKIIAAPLLSPALQGLSATGAGIASRQVLSPLTQSKKLSGAAYSSLSGIAQALSRKRRK